MKCRKVLGLMALAIASSTVIYHFGSTTGVISRQTLQATKVGSRFLTFLSTTVNWRVTDFPDCTTMAFHPNSSNHSDSHKGDNKNLCKIHTGTTRTDCVYRHPNVVHYVKFSSPPEKNVLSFRDYLSIFSVNRFYKPDKIIIFCNDINITGRYWELAKNLPTPIELRHTNRITSIGKDHSKPTYVTHEADYLKISNGLEEGGIYSDFDVVILNGTRLREMQRKSELVLGRDDGSCSRICAGFFSVVPGSKILRKWLDGYENDYR